MLCFKWNVHQVFMELIFMKKNEIGTWQGGYPVLPLLWAYVSYMEDYVCVALPTFAT